MTPDQLRAAGEALFGPRWQSDLAHALQVNPRTIRRWAAGSWPVPDGAERRIRELARQRAERLAALMRPPQA